MPRKIGPTDSPLGRSTLAAPTKGVGTAKEMPRPATPSVPGIYRSKQAPGAQLKSAGTYDETRPAPPVYRGQATNVGLQRQAPPPQVFKLSRWKSNQHPHLPPSAEKSGNARAAS